jgi:hypothetical protein
MTEPLEDPSFSRVLWVLFPKVISDCYSCIFVNFDRRECKGPDHPEFTHEMLRKRFDFFQGILLLKKNKISHKNLIKLINEINSSINF